MRSSELTCDHLCQAIQYNTLVNCSLNRMLQDEKNPKKNRPCKQLLREAWISTAISIKNLNFNTQKEIINVQYWILDVFFRPENNF